LFFIRRASLWRKFIWPRASSAKLPLATTLYSQSVCSQSEWWCSDGGGGGGGGGGGDVGADGVASLPERGWKSGVLPSRLTPWFLPRSTPGRQANQTVRVNRSLRLLLCTAVAHPLKKLKYSVLAPPSTASTPQTASTRHHPPRCTDRRSTAPSSSYSSRYVPTLLDFIITISSRYLPSLSSRSYPVLRASFLRGWRRLEGTWTI